MRNENRAPARPSGAGIAGAVLVRRHRRRIAGCAADLWAPAALFATLSFAGCGGGGGGGGGSSMPSITTSPSPVTATASVTAAAFANAPSTVYFMASDFSTSGINSVSAPVYNSTQGSFIVTFKSPSGLKPATYTDTDTLLLCSDPQCHSVLAKDPLTISYTVTATTGGSAPHVTLDSTTLTYQALSIDQYAVAVTSDPTAFTFANFPGSPYVQLSAPTTAGIDNMNFVMTDATHGGIAFTFRTPTLLAPGTRRSILCFRLRGRRATVGRHRFRRVRTVSCGGRRTKPRMLFLGQCQPYYRTNVLQCDQHFAV